MNRETLVRLIDKYSNGTCTPEETKALMEWYEATDEAFRYTDTLDSEQKEALENELLTAIKRASGLIPSTPRRVSGLTRPAWYFVAASIALVAIAVPLSRWWFSKPLSVHTAFGEIKSVVLPDDSEVMLNGNSTLTYQGDHDREVWLEGEAFFSVRPKPDKQRFIVHLADSLSIEVVGTEFNVLKRPSGTQIALQSGKIRLHYDGANATAKQIEMAPNDVICIGKYTDGGFEKSAAENLDSYLAWQQNKLSLDHTTLAEVLELLDETYNIKTSVLQDSVLSRKASGSVPVVADSKQFVNHIVTLYGLVIADTKNERHFVLTAQ
ncbi:FecR family protein [Parapedobacter sp. DT-150]|uniref:FecR family protein n=1 Tax=Parapedobacter sp. DT-150 TaxID=3396162 RepID=UPI003F1BE907